jgi:hypothetical protein
LNDTVVEGNHIFGPDEITLTLKNTKDNSDIDFDYEAGFARNDTLYIRIYPKDVLKGGTNSLLTIDFHDKIYIYDFLRFLDDQYSIEMVENPTNEIFGEVAGIMFHVVFVLLFIGLCVMIIADTDNICVLLLLTAFQRVFILFLINTRTSPFLASFAKHFAVVNFKAVYFDYIFKNWCELIDLAYSTQLYNSLGWFGYDTKALVYNSSGALSFIFIAILIYM